MPINELATESVQKHDKPLPVLQLTLIPASCWYRHVPYLVTDETWQRLQQWSWQQAGYRCEVCQQPLQAKVPCHELWKFDDRNLVQYLFGIQALCPDCYQVHQIAHLSIEQTQAALEHMAIVNQWSRTKAYDHFRLSIMALEDRSRYRWTLDVSWLDKLASRPWFQYRDTAPCHRQQPRKKRGLAIWKTLLKNLTR